MTWQERLAVALCKPRNPAWVQYLMLGLSGIIVTWGIVVCVLTTFAVASVVIEALFFNAV